MPKTLKSFICSGCSEEVKTDKFYDDFKSGLISDNECGKNIVVFKCKKCGFLHYFDKDTFEQKNDKLEIGDTVYTIRTTAFARDGNHYEVWEGEEFEFIGRSALDLDILYFQELDEKGIVEVKGDWQKTFKKEE